MFKLFNRWAKVALIGAIAVAAINTLPTGPNAASVTTSPQNHKSDGEYSLDFTTHSYTLKSITLHGQTIKYRSYENIVYVSNPVDLNFEIMNVYVPEAYFENASIGEYNAETAPIFFPNLIGGYMEAKPAAADKESVSLALSKGYVVASPGARGRTTQDENGLYTGKAPAAIVDLKAAVRYLRHNDKVMPGDADKIISNGTSAGGALSSLLGATGNNKDYEPYLKAIGAANERDDIFAVSSYCPITNLDHADIAYEWLFNGVNTYKWVGSGTLTPDQIQVSNELKALFPDYLNSLELKSYEPHNANGIGLVKAPGQVKKGTALTLDADGNGTFKDYVKSFVIQSAQKALDNGTVLTGMNWITIQDGVVTDIDFDKYVEYATRMKTPPAFDSLAASSWENTLFGTSTVNSQHFTQYSEDNSTVDAAIANEKMIKMMNPMYYIGNSGSTTSKHWRIRHGTKDRDTSLAIPVILATKLSNEGYDVDFSLPWDRPHSGDYDLEELFGWVDQIVKSKDH